MKKGTGRQEEPLLQGSHEESCLPLPMLSVIEENILWETETLGLHTAWFEVRIHNNSVV